MFMNIFYVYIDNCLTLLNFETFTNVRITYVRISLRRKNKIYGKFLAFFFIF